MENKKIYGVYTLDGIWRGTYQPPEEWKVIDEGWMKYWVEFTNTDGYKVKINPDLIVEVRTHE